ncbi:MAG TPA: peptidylprolyl isomerase [Azospirillaceae bacterium]|nr:peptidylprolyl isomerase [Azospirillaceae bacterium]
MTLNNTLKIGAAVVVAGAIGVGIAVQQAQSQSPATQSPAAQGPAQTTAPAPGKTDEANADPVVARVNGQEIKRSDVTATISQMPPQIQQMPVEIVFPAILDQMISMKLLAGAGYAQNLQNDPDVKERLRRAEERAVQEVYMQRQINARISDDKLRERYKEWVAENPPQDEVRASHILVDSEDKAKDLIKRLQDGADFALLAKENSTDPGSAPTGGDLGYFNEGDMVQPFAQAAFTLSPGALAAAPVKTQFGWHVIKVVDRRQGAVPAFEEVAPQLRNEMQQDVVAGIIEELRGSAKIERLGPDGTPTSGTSR